MKALKLGHAGFGFANTHDHMGKLSGISARKTTGALSKLRGRRSGMGGDDAKNRQAF
jgi:hypothetical protein